MDKEILHLIDDVDDFIGRPQDKLDDEILICECFCVNVRDIRSFCETKLDLDLLQRELFLGQGCRSCLKRKEDWMHKIF
jgi:hypothetical protein